MHRSGTSILSGLLVVTACGQSDRAPVAPPAATVASITVDALPAQMIMGDTAVLRAVPRDALGNELTGRTIEWLSSDQGILTVNSGGRVLTISPGTATVTAQVGSVRATTQTSVRLTTPERRIAYALIPHDAAMGPANAASAMNATGGDIRVTSRPGAGDYVITFARLARADTSWRETVMLTPGQSGLGTRCHLNGWNSAANGRDLDVSVSCYATNDSKIDKAFHIAVIGSGSLASRHGFVTIADAAQSHAPPGSAFYNSSGLPISVDRMSTGSYRVNVNNERTSAPENYFITTIGGPSATCLLDGWSFGTYSRSRCEWSDGSPVDARFAMQLVEGGRPGKRFGFAWASSPTATVGAEYEPSSGYQRVSTGGRVMITRTAPGAYEVRFPGLGELASTRHHLQVSPYQTARVGCQAWALPARESDFVARVACGSRGTLAPIDAFFTILLLE
jgi:hypothetical protein